MHVINTTKDIQTGRDSYHFTLERNKAIVLHCFSLHGMTASKCRLTDFLPRVDLHGKYSYGLLLVGKGDPHHIAP